jgi:hypothetical protein
MSSSSNNNHKKSVLDDKNKVTAQSYGNIQDSQTGKEAWMLRLPNKLAEAFDRAPEGTVLGELVFRKGGGKNSSIKPVLDIHVSPDVGVDPSVSATASAAASSLPLHYSLVMTKDVPTLHPFSRYANGSVKLHGTVTRSGNMQVYQDKNYRALLKDRILETSVNKKSYVKQVDANQVVQQTAARGSMADPSGKKGGFGEAVSVLGKRILEANERQQAGAAGTSADGKRMRFSDDMETKTIVFQLYEQKPFWTTKGKLIT